MEAIKKLKELGESARVKSSNTQLEGVVAGSDLLGRPTLSDATSLNSKII